MTSTADMTQHPDVSEISDLTEGLLSPAQSAGLRQHLESCALCTDVQASLVEIRGMLGTLPGETRMPSDIAERIDAALAAEALLDSTAPAGGPRVSRETPPPAQRQEPKVTERPTGHARGMTGPGRGRPARRRRRRAVVGIVFGVAAAGVSVLLLQTMQFDDADKSSSTSQDASVSSSAGTRDLADSDLEDRVHHLLTGGPADRQPKADKEKPLGAKEASPSPRAGIASSVPPCIQQGTGRPDSPIAFEISPYRGSDAYLVVFPDPANSERVQAYVIDGACVSAADTPPAGKLLLTKSYARP
ncbi:hypothetical protein ACWF94_27850 [Streptomyces sp. NPDC055078]